jgi:hypothetical protein
MRSRRAALILIGVRIGTIVLKVADVGRAARFWTGALDYVVRDADGSPTLGPAAGDGPTITLDADDRTHLDLFVAGEDELRAEVDRLVALGARRVPWTYAEHATHVVLADTEGNLFCVVNTDSAL